MKLNSNALAENLTAAEVKKLLTITAETVDPNFKINKKRIFTAAQYFEIQKRKRNFSARRLASA